MMSASTLRISDLACRRGDRLLFSQLSFTLAPGEILEVCGRNGTGKTTLLRMLCGLRQPDEGEIHWDTDPIGGNAEAFRESICYIGHLPGLKADLSPLANLRAEAALFGLDADLAEGALERLGLAREMHLPCSRLSAGQTQRAALARLLMRSASLWILDEPCASLDRDAQAQVQSLLEAHAGEGGQVVFTTHQPLEISQVKVTQLWLGAGQTDA